MPWRTATPTPQIKWKAVTSCSALESARMWVVFFNPFVLPWEISRETDASWLHPAIAVIVYKVSGNSSRHPMGRLEEGDTNSTARQTKSYWTTTAKVRDIISFKAKRCHSELSCLQLNAHTQKTNWKKKKKVSSPKLLWFLLSWSQRSLNFLGQQNNANSHFSDALEPSWRMRKFVRGL